MGPEARGLTAEALYGTLGIVIMGWALFDIPPDWLLPLLLIAGLVLLVTPYSIRMSDPMRLPAAMPIELMVMLVAPPQVSIFVAGFVNLSTSINYRRPFIRTLFNVANLALPNALAVGFLALVAGPWPRPLVIPHDLPLIAMAIAIRMMANGIGQAVIMPEVGHASLWAFARSLWVDEWRTGGLGIRFLPVLMALAYPTTGLWVLPIGVIVQVAMGASMRRYQERVDLQTLVDGLTGLANRKAWEVYRKTRPATGPTAVAVVDIDGLKATNDTHGHERGDAVLIDLAQRLRLAAPGGEVFRIGGDEFLIVLPQKAMTGGHKDLAAAIAAFGQEWQGNGVPVSASFGVAHCPTEGSDLTMVTALADNRMYHMKSGRVVSRS